MDSISSFTIPASSVQELSSSSNVNVTACWSFHVDGSPNCKPTSCVIGYNKVFRGEFTKLLCHCSMPCLNSKPETDLELSFPWHRVVECTFSLLKSQFRCWIAVGESYFTIPENLTDCSCLLYSPQPCTFRNGLRAGELPLANSDGQ